MFCKRCGNALPSHGFVCLNCGAMMSPEQIKEQKELMKKDHKNEVILKSDFYSKEPINRNYEKPKDNKIIGALIILVIVIVLIVLAILKVM